jgi:hypothetical protein
VTRLTYKFLNPSTRFSRLRKLKLLNFGLPLIEEY